MSNGKDRRATAERFARAGVDNEKGLDAKESAMRIFAAKGEGADAARIIVNPTGEAIEVVDPELLRGRHEDIVIWFCENRTNQSIKVEVRDFKKRFSRRGVPPPVDFQTANPVGVPANGNALIVGWVNHDPNAIEFFKYTVRVSHGGQVHDHDPDLEIKP
jgi:hypothetical protein